MKHLLSLIMLAGFTGVLFAQEGTDGKTIFTANKCQACHSVTAAGVEAGPVEEGEEPGSDLSSVGIERAAEWITAYLEKKEAINGKKHMKKFKGTPDDLKALSAWLAEQKKPKE
jgi:mono/diheme cytochrome c family protein